MRQQWRVFETRLVMLFVVFVAVAQYCIYFYTNANNHFSSPFFDITSLVHDYPIYSSKVHSKPSLHPFSVPNTPHITSRHKIYLAVRCINTEAISWWIENPHALYSILKGLHQRWKEECCTQNDKILRRRWSVGQR